jgi:hypothetical protein
MKVHLRNKNYEATIDDIEVGEVFRYKDHTYIKTNGDEDFDLDDFLCVLLETGECAYLEGDTVVRPSDASVIVTV